MLHNIVSQTVLSLELLLNVFALKHNVDVAEKSTTNNVPVYSVIILKTRDLYNLLPENIRVY